MIIKNLKHKTQNKISYNHNQSMIRISYIFKQPKKRERKEQKREKNPRDRRSSDFSETTAWGLISDHRRSVCKLLHRHTADNREVSSRLKGPSRQLGLELHIHSKRFLAVPFLPHLIHRVVALEDQRRRSDTVDDVRIEIHRR